MCVRDRERERYLGREIERVSVCEREKNYSVHQEYKVIERVGERVFVCVRERVRE